jgi:hypothetical protein
MGAEARLNELGITLPAVSKPVANYLPYRLAGNLLFLLGQGPRDEKGNVLTGKLGGEIRIDEGYRRARLICLGLLAAMHDALGSLDRVARPSSDHSTAYMACTQYAQLGEMPDVTRGSVSEGGSE